MRFGDWLKKNYLRLELNQEEFALALGFENRQSISNWAQHEHLPPMKELSQERLLRGLGYETIEDMTTAYKAGQFPDIVEVRKRLAIKPRIPTGSTLVAYHLDMSGTQVQSLERLTDDQQRAAFGMAWAKLTDEQRNQILADVRKKPR